MALDLSKYETPAESPEVTALKKRVVQVTKKYTDRNGWCEEANKALREMGVLPDTPTDVTLMVALKSGLTFEVPTPVAGLIGKSEEEQRDVVAKAIGSLRVYSGDNTRIGRSRQVGTIPVTADDLASLELKPDPSGGWYVGSERGKVLHFFGADSVRQIESGSVGWVYPLCGIECRRSSVQPASSVSITDHCTRCTTLMAQS